jgi:hypothetical protein
MGRCGQFRDRTNWLRRIERRIHVADVFRLLGLDAQDVVDAITSAEFSDFGGALVGLYS